MHATPREAWNVFGLKAPPSWPDTPRNRTFIWTEWCNPEDPLEISAGELLINKRKAWRGLWMSVFINRNSHFFLTRLFYGDKQTFVFGFNTTSTPYALAPKHPFDIGLVTVREDGRQFFGTNTVAPRHPVTGEPAWLHRHAPKFVWTWDYLQFDPVPRAWTHIAKQDRYGSWDGLVRSRTDVPQELFVPSPEHQFVLHPKSGNVDIRLVSNEV